MRAVGAERPGTKSLWLLPSGSDQVGDSPVRPTPGAHMGEGLRRRKFRFAFIGGSRERDDVLTAEQEAN